MYFISLAEIPGRKADGFSGTQEKGLQQVTHSNADSCQLILPHPFLIYSTDKLLLLIKISIIFLTRRWMPSCVQQLVLPCFCLFS